MRRFKNNVMLFFCFAMAGLLFVGTPAFAMSPSDIWGFVFHPGASTQTTTYNDNTTFEGTVNWFKKGVRIGEQGAGGVTFFNGTIVNDTIKNGAGNPVTFGDDIRIDGDIFRTERGGSNALRLGDSMVPSLTNTYSLGSSSKKFKNAYFAGTVSANILSASSLSGSGIVSTNNLASNAVTSSKISNGTIVGADVAASADLNIDTLNLSGTNGLSFDNDTSLRRGSAGVLYSPGTLTMGGDVGIGTTNPDTEIHIVSADADYAELHLDSYINGNYAPQFMTRRALGTQGSPLAVTSGAQLGGFSMRGWNGSDWSRSSAKISAYAAENWTPTAWGANLYFQTVGLGSTSLENRMVVAADGNVGIGTTAPARPLHVSDVLRLEPRASAPSSPSEGDIYVDSDDNHFYCYLNGSWKQLDN